jgi:hypothetical protein
VDGGQEKAAVGSDPALVCTTPVHGDVGRRCEVGWEEAGEEAELPWSEERKARVDMDLERDVEVVGQAPATIRREVCWSTMSCCQWTIEAACCRALGPCL